MAFLVMMTAMASMLLAQTLRGGPSDGYKEVFAYVKRQTSR